MNKFAKLSILVAVISVNAISAFAQQCPAPYQPQDRQAVHAFFAGGPKVSTAESVTPTLRRMHFIALRIMVEKISSLERAAIGYEYQANLSELDRLGQTGIRGVSSSTNRYVATIVKQSFLGLEGTTLHGRDEAAARMNAANAAAATFQALETVWKCF